MQDQLPKVFIIVLGWNRADDTIECFESLSRLDYPNCQLILVDNGSTDNTISELQKKVTAVHILQNHDNLGYTGGNNVGIQYALQHSADYVFLLNNDALVNSDTIRKLVAVAESNPKLGMLFPTIVSYHNRRIEYVGTTFHWPDTSVNDIVRESAGLPKYVPADYAPGCGVLVRNNVIRDIGLLDERYFAYYEDLDWSLRCRRAGHEVAAVPAAKIYHKGTPDQILSKSALEAYFYWRNRVLFMRQHGKFTHWPGFLKAYVRKSLESIAGHVSRDDLQKAHAVIDGCWAGILGRYGAARLQSPQMIRKHIVGHLSSWMWLTGWLYALDYHREKRRKRRAAARAALHSEEARQA